MKKRLELRRRERKRSKNGIKVLPLRSSCSRLQLPRCWMPRGCLQSAAPCSPPSAFFLLCLFSSPPADTCLLLHLLCLSASFAPLLPAVHHQLPERSWQMPGNENTLEILIPWPIELKTAAQTRISNILISRWPHEQYYQGSSSSLKAQL